MYRPARRLAWITAIPAILGVPVAWLGSTGIPYRWNIPQLGDPRGAARGCAFADRCSHARDRCLVEVPLLRDIAPGHRAACHHAERVLAEAAAPGAKRVRGKEAEAHLAAPD